jgi:hypothetical protein
MKRAMMVLLLTAGTILAQQSQPATPDANERIQKLVPVKYADVVSIQNLLFNFGVETRVDQRLKVVALTGRRAAVETAEAAIKQLDVPASAQKDIDLTVYFVVGTDATEPGAQPPVPQELQSTVATLKSNFPFKNYYLLDALSLRSRSGVGASTTGQLSSNRLTTFSVRSVNVEGDGNMIRLDGLHAGIRRLESVGTKLETVNVSGVDADVLDVKEGQKLVVGRSSLEGPGKALFLVLIAKVAQ